MEIISSTKNEKIKNISALLKSKKVRDEQGVFVIEGIRIFKDTLKTAPEYIESVYISESVLFDSQPKIGDISAVTKITTLFDVSLSNTVSVYVVKDSVLDSVSGTVTTQGVIAIVRKPNTTLENLLTAGNAKNAGNSIIHIKTRLLILENIQDPGNLGTMLRTAEAAGMTGIIMSGDCTDIFSPKVARASMGSIFRMPFVYCDDFIKALNEIKENGITIYAAYLHGGVPYKEIAFDNNYAILIGNEGNGLTDEAVNAASKRIFIPMSGEIESLNAAVAAAILMYK